MTLLSNASLLVTNSNNSIYNASDITCSDLRFIPNIVANRAALRYFLLVNRVFACPLLSLWSVTACIVNIAAFCKMGLKEGVTQNFLILSVADGLQGLFHVAQNICLLLQYFRFSFKMVCAQTLLFHLSILKTFPQSVSTITTAMIAVVRCCCVTMPFTVQRTFTARSQLVALLVLCGANSIFLAYVSAKAILDLHDISINGNERIHLLKENSIFMYDVASVSVFSACYTVTFVSMLILIGALKYSSRFRSNMSSTSVSTPNVGINARDTHIIKGICQVLAAFTFCNVLSLYMSIERFLTSETSVNKQGSPTVKFSVIASLCEILLQINIGVNIFIFYRNNNRFKVAVNRFLQTHG